MLRLAFAAPAAALALLPLAALAVEERAPDIAAGATAVVVGLSPNDLLNVRATASPTGIVLGRLEKGTAVTSFGCDEVNGYKWCRVQALNDAKIAGWAPGRYLNQAEAPAPPQDTAEPGPEQAATARQETETVQTAATTPPSPTLPEPTPAVVREPRQKDDVAIFEPPAPVLPEPTTVGSVQKYVAPLRNAPDNRRQDRATRRLPDLAARLGSEAPLAFDAQQRSAAAIGQDAARTALDLAFADDRAAVADEIYSAGPGSDGVETTGDSGDAPPASVESSPTPRPALQPEQATAPVETSAIVAQAQSESEAAVTFDATGEVPCARYVGQPMTRCEAGIVRKSAAVEVTVTWPDGGKRVIRFRNGKPESANSRGEFRFTREGDLNMIRIGLAERFEIPDSLPYGD